MLRVAVATDEDNNEYVVVDDDEAVVDADSKAENRLADDSSVTATRLVHCTA